MSDKNSDQEKTEEPTAKKLEDARKEGNVSISTEVSSMAVLTTAVLMFVATSSMIGEQVSSLFETFFINSGQGFANKDEAMSHLSEAMWGIIGIIGPTMSILLIVTLIINLAQTGGVFSVKAIQPKGSKMSPMNGLKKIFSAKGAVELIKGFAKLFIVGLIGYYTVRNDVSTFVEYMVSPLEHSMSEMGSYILMFVTRVLAALLVLSIADAIYQRFQHHKDLRMSKQEVKDEYKQMEGDPHVKGQRKRFGMELRNKKRLDHAVLSSDVVVTNPTHYAVALRYEPENNNAPIVVVKGQRLRALRIKELAKEYGIPIVENKPVARALFATAEEDEFIPEDLFRAVAEILAYVYKLKKSQKV
ncbi:MAG: flagellar biosynthesis protein FlhB [Balneola sp.]|nr:flagellar biosynthesis protein FlhB [Balneola sp.]|tara:strand:- start:75872 stop:76948 length:1077 start_codon:yes stop_codon:yes gene_type:complete